MVQVFSVEPTMSTGGLVGQAMAQGLAKRAGIAEAEQAFQQAKGDPLKLATAFARLTSVSPELARGAGPMYEAMLRGMQGQAMGQGMGVQQPQEFPYPTTADMPEQTEIPTITNPEDVQRIIQGYVDPTQEQIINEAGQIYRQNPMMFQGDPNLAVDYVQRKYDQQRKRVESARQRLQDTTELQDDVVNRLKNQVKELGANIPARAQSEYEQEAIDQLKKGRTAEQVTRDIGKKIDEASRKYQQIESIGSRGLLTNNKESMATLRALQKDFKKRNDLRNFSHSIQGDLKISPPVAWAISDPVSDYPELNKFLKDLPYNSEALDPALQKENTEKILPQLAKLIEDGNGSPQAVFYEMQRKNYNPRLFKDFLDRKRDDYKLNALQLDQLGEQINPAIPFLNDVWIRIWGGL